MFITRHPIGCCFVILLLFISLYKLFHNPHYIIPFSLSLLSGLSTVFGSLIVIHRSTALTNRDLALVCGLAAGVMLFVSIIDMLIPAMLNTNIGSVSAILLFLSGAGLIKLGLIIIPERWLLLLAGTDANNAAITVRNSPMNNSNNNSPNKLLYNDSDPDTDTDTDLELSNNNNNAGLAVDPVSTLRFGVLTAIIIGLHNLPEGLAVFISSLDSVNHGILLSLSIAIHNIAEGLIVATPIYAATNSKSTAVLWTIISGCSEPIGALISLVFTTTATATATATATDSDSIINSTNINSILCIIGGIMLTISISELIPEGRKYQQNKYLFSGILIGILTMATTRIIVEGFNYNS